MGKCHGQRLFCNLPFIKRDLGVILKKPYGYLPVRQAALALQMIFLYGLSDDSEIGIRNPLPVSLILLVQKMLIGKKLYLFLPGITFVEYFVYHRNNQLSAVI